MTSMMKIFALSNTPNCQVHLMYYGTNWHFSWKGTVDNAITELKADKPTIDEAVDSVYDRFVKLTSVMPEFAGLLPPPPPPTIDFQDADHMLRPDKPQFQSPIDDDIPF